MTSKLVIRESESPLPAALSILISQMTSSSVIIPYIKQVKGCNDYTYSVRHHVAHSVLLVEVKASLFFEKKLMVIRFEIIYAQSFNVVTDKIYPTI